MIFQVCYTQYDILFPKSQLLKPIILLSNGMPTTGTPECTASNTLESIMRHEQSGFQMFYIKFKKTAVLFLHTTITQYSPEYILYMCII